MGAEEIARNAASRLDGVETGAGGVQTSFSLSLEISTYGMNKAEEAINAGRLVREPQAVLDYVNQEQVNLARMIQKYDDPNKGYNINIKFKDGKFDGLDFTSAKK